MSPRSLVATLFIASALVLSACTAGDGTDSETVVTNDRPESTTTTRSEPDPPGYAELVAASDPVGFWRLDDSSGTTATASAGSFDATLAGGVSLAEPPAVEDGTSIRLDGSSGHIWIGEADSPVAEALAGASELTVELWFRPAPGSETVSPQHLARWRWFGWGIYLVDGVVHAELWEESAGTPTPSGIRLSGPELAANQWHHLALVKDAGAVRLFVDGRVVAQEVSRADVFTQSVAPSDDCCGTGGGVAFGRDADVDGNYASGWMDEIAIYQTALSETAIADRWNARAAG